MPQPYKDILDDLLLREEAEELPGDISGAGGGRLRSNMDATRISDGRPVMLKKLLKEEGPHEVRINKFFSTEPLSSDPRNYCGPLIESHNFETFHSSRTYSGTDTGNSWIDLGNKCTLASPGLMYTLQMTNAMELPGWTGSVDDRNQTGTRANVIAEGRSEENSTALHNWILWAQLSNESISGSNERPTGA
ncbi:hypothetical protein DFH94DRAFT_686738 [Russula ochroleuca]|uniref:Uncharacterized protein n=1 Tax=Russula ochroleuca TaxID=152965 RepID=A0A9P5MPC1_9AGAM|nr:hypothetical protein DFH94DRAFT_686738 [Russula ochroleuca]